MRDVLAALPDALRSRLPFAYCRLVTTRGSTPQKAGAVMLVHADGRQTGTLGGGCVEAEVKKRALGLLSGGAPQIMRFQLDHDYGWDDGLICGGRMDVQMVAVTADERAYFQQLADLAQSDQGSTEAVVAEAPEDSDAAQLGASYLFGQDGQLVIARQVPRADDPPPSSLVDNLRPLDERPRPYFADKVAYLPLLRRCRLIIVGGGHVGKAVADLAVDLDFDVWIVDDREEYVAEERFPQASQRLSGPIDDLLENLDVTPDTYCLIVTRGHQHDQRALFFLAEKGARYVGLIGSRRKIRLIYDNLAQEGVSEAALERVFAPLGIDIGSQTVPEIAVSICAELVSHRNRNGFVPGREKAAD